LIEPFGLLANRDDRGWNRFYSSSRIEEALLPDLALSEGGAPSSCSPAGVNVILDFNNVKWCNTISI
jgi:hypothetical protein